MICSTCGAEFPSVPALSAHRKIHRPGYTPKLSAAHQNERILIYWLLRALQAQYRQGFEEGPSANETFDSILHVLANFGFDPFHGKGEPGEIVGDAKELLRWEKPPFGPVK